MISLRAELWVRRISSFVLPPSVMRLVQKGTGIVIVLLNAGISFLPVEIRADEDIRYWNLKLSGRYDLDYNWWLTPEGGATTVPNGPDAVAAFLLGGNKEASPWVIDFTFISPEVDHFYFGEDAGYYSMNVGGSTLTFSGLGVVNESGKEQVITVGNNGQVIFQNGASAGFSRLTATGSGKLVFRDNATATDAIVRGALDFSQINAGSFKAGLFLGGSVTMGSKSFILDGLGAGEELSINGFFNGTDLAFLIQQDQGSRALTQVGTAIGGVRLDSGTLTIDGGSHTWSSLSHPLDIRNGDMIIRGGAEVNMAGGEAQIRGENGASASLTITGTGTEVTVADGFFIAGRDFHGDQRLEISDGAVFEVRDFWVGFHGAGAATIDRARISALGAVVGTGDSLDDRGDLEITGSVSLPGRLFVQYDLDVGGRQWESSGSGYLFAGAWTTVRANNLNLARAVGGDGEVEISGWDANLEVLDDLTSGYAGTGRLIVSNGAKAEVADDVYIGRSSGSDGTITVRGSGTRFDYAGGMAVGNHGEGRLFVENGAVVRSTGVGEQSGIGVEDDGKGEVKVDGGTLNISQGGFGIGVEGKGLLEVTGGGEAMLGAAALGYLPGGSGELIVSNGGRVSVAGGGGALSVGYSSGSEGVVSIGGRKGEAAKGAGILNVSAIAFGSGDGELRFNHNETTYNFVNSAGNPILVVGYGDLIHEGPGTTVLSANTVEVNNVQADSGSLVFTSASAKAKSDVIVGTAPESKGEIVVRGSGKTLDYEGGMGVGYYGEGRLLVENGALLRSTVPGKESGIGVKSGSKGEVKVDGGVLNIAQGSLGIGTAGRGLLEVTGGGEVLLGAAAVGYEPGGEGELVLSDGGRLSLTGGVGTLYVGYAAGSSGTVSIGGRSGEAAAAAGVLDAAEILFGNGGGELRFNHNNVFYAFTNSNGIDVSIAGKGSVIHEGSGTTLLSGNNTYTGGTWLRGGLLKIAEGSSAGNNLIFFEGGAIEWMGERPVLTGIGGNGNFDFGSESLRLNQDIDTEFGGTLGGTGDLVKDGVGRLTLSGGIEYTGMTTVHEGAVVFTHGLLSEGDELMIAPNATLASGNKIVRDVRNDGTVQALEGTLHLSGEVSGNGVFSGDFHFSGTTRPGTSPGLLMFEGDLSFSDEHVLEMEIAGLLRGGNYDALDITGSFTAGGLLVVTFLNGFQPELGDSFFFLNVGGTIYGQFGEVVLPALENPAARWDTSNLYTTGVVIVVPEPQANTLLIFGLVSAAVLWGRRRKRSE